MADQTPKKAPRKAIAKRLWLDAQGIECDEEKATQGGYDSLASKRGVRFTPVTTDPATRMYAIFGFQTLSGNEVNSAPDGTDGIDQAQARLDLLKSGQWVDRSGGGGGIRFDKDKLAEAIAQVTKRPIADVRPKLEWRVNAATGAQVPDDDKSAGTCLYGTRALKIPAVKAAYEKLVPQEKGEVPDVKSL